jgi:hypothetical protein
MSIRSILLRVQLESKGSSSTLRIIPGVTYDDDDNYPTMNVVETSMLGLHGYGLLCFLSLAWNVSIRNSLMTFGLNFQKGRRHVVWSLKTTTDRVPSWNADIGRPFFFFFMASSVTH